MLSVNETMKDGIQPSFPLPSVLKDEPDRGVSMERDERRVFSSIIILVCIVSLIFGGGFRELLFPPFVYFLVVKIGKHEFKDIQVPTRGVALDVFFDILQPLLSAQTRNQKRKEKYLSNGYKEVGQISLIPREVLTSQTYCRRGR